MLSGPETPEDALALFFSYAHEDEGLRDELAKHLALLEREGAIRPWHDRRIRAGEPWARRIDERLESADLVLFLVSPDFLASDYCWNVEMKSALARHDDGTARVIPVVVRPTDWEKAPFGELQALPRDARAVTTWDDRDEAWLVAWGIVSPLVGRLQRAVEGDAAASAVLKKMAGGEMERRRTPGEDRLRWLGIIMADGPRRWRWVAPVFEEWASIPEEGRAEARASAPPLSRWGQFPIFTGMRVAHRATP